MGNVNKWNNGTILSRNAYIWNYTIQFKSCLGKEDGMKIKFEINYETNVDKVLKRRNLSTLTCRRHRRPQRHLHDGGGRRGRLRLGAASRGRLGNDLSSARCLGNAGGRDATAGSCRCNGAGILILRVLKCQRQKKTSVNYSRKISRAATLILVWGIICKIYAFKCLKMTWPVLNSWLSCVLTLSIMLLSVYNTRLIISRQNHSIVFIAWIHFKSATYR